MGVELLRLTVKISGFLRLTAMILAILQQTVVLCLTLERPRGGQMDPP